MGKIFSFLQTDFTYFRVSWKGGGAFVHSMYNSGIISCRKSDFFPEPWPLRQMRNSAYYFV
jgi:hypothetical protein